MRAVFVLCCVAVALAWAPLLKMENRVEGSYLVVFNEKPANMASVPAVEAWLAANFNGISNVVKSAWLIESPSSRFRGFSASLTLEQVQVLQLSNDIAHIEEDSIVSIAPLFANDTRVQDDASDWGIQRVDQRCLPLTGEDPNVCQGKSSDCTGSNSVVWVVDTGVRVSHTEFGGVGGRASISANFALGDPSQYNGDCNGHGTHVAGSVAGTNYGVAKRARINSVRVLNCQGSGTTANVIDGFNFVGNNADLTNRNILSASLGGGFSTTTNNAIDTVAGKGVICIVAAGNDNANACNYSPASASQVITVGSTDKSDTRSSFSNFGTCVDVFAPGSSITSAWYTSDTALNTISGTSMATPIVSGSVAVLTGGIDPTRSAIVDQISAFATRDVVKNAGANSPNLLIYDRWNDGTSTTCQQ